MVKKILFITLSNIGDCILTLPVLDTLIDKYTGAEFSVLVGPRAKEVFANNHNIGKIIAYDKKVSLIEVCRFVMKLRKDKYDLVVDLRNTLFPFFLGARLVTKFINLSLLSGMHMKDRHLRKIKMRNAECGMRNTVRHFFLENKNANNNKYGNYVVVAPGSLSHLKRWDSGSFAKLCDKIDQEFGFNIILVGGKEDRAITDEIISKMRGAVVNLAGLTSISDLACLVKGAKLVITCDSACMHLASYLNTPIVAIFGPTDENKYGPWSDKSVVVKNGLDCRPCEKAQCKFGTIKCMAGISANDVFKEAQMMLVQ